MQFRKEFKESQQEFRSEIMKLKNNEIETESGE
jgi:hypothetical protein